MEMQAGIGANPQGVVVSAGLPSHHQSQGAPAIQGVAVDPVSPPMPAYPPPAVEYRVESPPPVYHSPPQSPMPEDPDVNASALEIPPREAGGAAEGVPAAWG